MSKEIKLNKNTTIAEISEKIIKEIQNIIDTSIINHPKDSKSTIFIPITEKVDRFQTIPFYLSHEVSEYIQNFLYITNKDKYPDFIFKKFCSEYAGELSLKIKRLNKNSLIYKISKWFNSND